MVSTTTSLPNPEPQTIAVFGSTGFLGPYIVAALLQRHIHAHIHCLNRSPEGEQRTRSALKRIYDGLHDLNRLHFTVTDITQPRLGLDASQYTFFVSEVDEVVFNAWNANWGIPLKAFTPLLGANPSINLHLIQLCHPRLATTPPRTTPHTEQPALDINCATDSGYGKSKCIAEQLLTRAHSDSGLRVAIIRAGQVAGVSSPTVGSASWPIQGWLWVTFKTAQKLGAWPVHMSALDWIPVDKVVEGIANVTGEQASNDTVHVYNMMHPDPAPWDILYKTLQTRFGLIAETVTLPQWLDRLDPKTFKMHAFLSGAGEGREAECMVFENGNALRVLPRVEKINGRMLERWLEGWSLGLRKTRAML